MIAGFVTPKSGNVFFDGKDIADLPPYKRPVNTVFQKYALFPHLNVFENVAFGLRLKKLPEEEIQHRVAALLEMVGMPATQSMMPAELSGGMKKRVGLARALAMQPQVVFYDEPTSGLDPVMTMTISRLIRKTQQTLGVTSVLVTHDMESAYFAADRIAMLYKGKIVQVGTPDEIKRSRNPIVHAFVNGLELKEEDADEQQ